MEVEIFVFLIFPQPADVSASERLPGFHPEALLPDDLQHTPYFIGMLWPQKYIYTYEFHVFLGQSTVQEVVWPTKVQSADTGK